MNNDEAMPAQSPAGWVAVNAGLTDLIVGGLDVSGTNIFAMTRGGVFRSGDQGES